MSHRSRRGLATWLTASSTPLFVLDEQRVVLVFNRGCEELTGWPAEEVIGQRCEYPVQSDPTLVSALTSALCPPAALQGTRGVARRVLVHRQNRQLHERDIHFFLLENDQKERAHILGVVAETVPENPDVGRPVRHGDLMQHLAELHQKFAVDRLIAKSAGMQRVAAQVELARTQPVPVHLTGEQGTGKEHVARLIHYGGQDRKHRFVPLRCGTASHFELSRTLNRLSEQQEGVARVGSVYLDYVDRLPRDLQSLTLKLMEQSDLKIRWFSAACDGIDQLTEEAFDPVLKMRLTPLTIRLPPLREREGDLLLLAQQILEEADRESGRAHDGFTPAVEQRFLRYSWPGNVEELARVVMRAAQQTETPSIDLDQLPFEFLAGQQGRDLRPADQGAGLEERLALFERELIEAALLQTRGNKSAAAELLGVPRARLYRRLEALGLEDQL